MIVKGNIWGHAMVNMSERQYGELREIYPQLPQERDTKASLYEVSIDLNRVLPLIGDLDIKSVIDLGHPRERIAEAVHCQLAHDRVTELAKWFVPALIGLTRMHEMIDVEQVADLATEIATSMLKMQDVRFRNIVEDAHNADVPKDPLYGDRHPGGQSL